MFYFIDKFMNKIRRKLETKFWGVETPPWFVDIDGDFMLSDKCPYKLHDDSCIFILDDYCNMHDCEEKVGTDDVIEYIENRVREKIESEEVKGPPQEENEPEFQAVESERLNNF